MRPKLNLIGKKSGRLTVIKEGKKQKGVRYFWCLCKCPSKNKTLVRMNNLTSGATRSCGCLQRERAAIHLRAISKSQKDSLHPRFKHGLSQTPAGRAFYHMIKRCYDPHDVSYPHYHALGIIVEPVWHDKLEQFVKDMGQPAEGRSLDRLDSLGNYEPSNCHWATKEQQDANQTRHSKLIPSKVRYVSKSGRVSRRKVNQTKMMLEIRAVMAPPQTGICGGCNRRCFYDDKFCGRAECNNDETIKLWQPFVERTAPAPINVWN